MSVILNEAATRAIKEAYNSYMKRNWNEYTYYLQVAEKTIDAIRNLDKSSDRLGCELELLCLEGELLLVGAFSYLENPRKLLDQYEKADKFCMLQPSRVLTREMPYLPPGLDLTLMLADLSEEDKQTEKDFSDAIALYSKITNGGGIGVNYLFGAAYALRQKDLDKARARAEKAQEIGGEWITPHARKLIMKIDEEMK